MTIHLPDDVERDILAQVDNGRFASVDDALAAAARLLLRELDQRPTKPVTAANDPGLGSIGAMRDAADELDQVVAEAYRRRRQETWRDVAVE